MIGDDIFITEETYFSKIGNLVMTIDLLVKRVAVKDNAIKEKDVLIEDLNKKIVELETPKESS